MEDVRLPSLEQHMKGVGKQHNDLQCKLLAAERKAIIV